jgi:hypothetical protein
LDNEVVASLIAMWCLNVIEMIFRAKQSYKTTMLIDQMNVTWIRNIK